MTNPRARDLGVPFEGACGPLNAITDVAGVEVGHHTLICGDGRLKVGDGPVRTGVTAILPRGRKDPRLAFGGAFSWNGSGEMTGTTYLDERGFIEGPVLITNTHSVGIVRDAAIDWMRRNGWPFSWTTPIVGETYDGRLNDIDGQHVRAQHAWAALDCARGGFVEEGAVGGGTGMMCFQYKAGIGTSSRVLPSQEGSYTVGVLVQANFGKRRLLRLPGRAPFGEWLLEDMPGYRDPELCPQNAAYPVRGGSIIAVVATDAPLLPHQLKRLAKRPTLGIARLGGGVDPSSGDIFLAFSTANASAHEGQQPDMLTYPVALLSNGALEPLLEAAANATEEAIVNAMVAARTMEGINSFVAPAISHERLRAAYAFR